MNIEKMERVMNTETILWSHESLIRQVRQVYYESKHNSKSSKSYWYHPMKILARIGETRMQLALFGFPKGCSACLTQLKLNGTYLESADKRMIKKLDLLNNDLIPSLVPDVWRPTLKTLYEFAGLQLIAEYGEAACRRAGVLED